MRFLQIVQKGLVPMVWLVFAAGLSACGGSQFAGGVGSGGSGVAEGSVSGFGSVIVDGVAYGDDAATVERWGESGVAEAKLGQRVRVQHDGKGQANRIVVLPQLIGSASHAPDAQGDFVLLGQRVRVVGLDDANYPATYFDGLTQVATGDMLEVHGSWSRDSQSRSVLIASRIEKLTSAPSALLLTAPVYARTGQMVTLEDAQRTVVSAADVPDTVQAGVLVSLWLTPSAVQTPATQATPWWANRVLLASASVDNDALLDLRAVVSDSDSQQGRVRVQGLWIKLPADWREPVPAVGTPVQLQVQRQASNANAWQASSLSIERKDQQADVEIKGSLRWTGDTGVVQLRGTSVQLSASVLTGACARLQPGQEVYVNLKAKRRSPGQPPQAAQIECSVQIPDSSVQEAQGRLQSVNSSQKTLDVLVGGTVLTLQWSSGQTLMPDPSQLRSGMAVEIEYQRSSNGLMLRKLKPD